MSKKNSIKKIAALSLGVALTMGATGCDFIRTDSMKDLAQTVATVNIANMLSEADGAEKLNAIFEIGGVGKDIPKRDLVSYFMNVGYQYVQSYGYSYEDTFNMLLDMLVSRKIVTQYAMLYYLNNNSKLSAEKCAKYINAQLAEAKTEREKQLLKAHPEVSAMKYFLTEYDVDAKKAEKQELWDKTLYGMFSAINNTLDNSESAYITASSEDHNHTDARTKPTNADVEKEDFYIAPRIVDGVEVDRYEVYTGLNKNGIPYGYKALDGSTVTTRKKAYNAFIGNLDDNGLIKKEDNTSVIYEMEYYYVELASRLEQALIEKYTDDLIAKGEKELSAEYLNSRYDQTYNAQKLAYDKDVSAFETAIGSLSDTNFVMYSPVENYGFVYNILIPFSEEQNRLYKQEEARATNDAELYRYRSFLLDNVVAKDLRTSWFDEHDHANSAFVAEDLDYYKKGDNKKKYLFFKDNLTNNERYEELDVYLGQYPFNGSVEEKDNGEYKLKANTMNIDEFLAEMEGYLNYAVGEDGSASGAKWEDTYVSSKNDLEYKLNEDKTSFTDYGQFVYYSGKVTFEEGKEVTAANYFNPETPGYKAAAAFNELMFAYSTDTGCLNTYMGYVVSPFKTNYVPEFEYAAQWAVAQGAGTYVVCPSTYGWHIIYVTYAYSADDVYGGYKAFDPMEMSEEEYENTFSDLYAKAMKEQYSADYATDEQNRLILEYDNETCVNRNKKTYQDLLDLDK